MRKIALALASASTIIASPALARDDHSYAGVGVGVVFPGEIDYEVVDTGDVVTADPGNNWNLDLEGVIGYDFGLLRVEAEAGYKKFDIETLQAPLPVGLVDVDDGCRVVHIVPHQNRDQPSRIIALLKGALVGHQRPIAA